MTKVCTREALMSMNVVALPPSWLASLRVAEV